MKFFLIILIFFIVCGRLNILGQTSLEHKDLLDSLNKIKFRSSIIETFSQKPHNLIIRNQKDFDSINVSIRRSISNGFSNICVVFTKGVYYYTDKHICINNLKDSLKISIKGNNSILIASGVKFDNKANYFNPFATYVDSKHKLSFNGTGPTECAEGLIELVDRDEKEFRLPFSKAVDKTELDCRQMYITITQWYKSKTYRVKEIKGGWIHFYADEVKYIIRFGRDGYSVNYDYIYAGVNPRFRLCTLELLLSQMESSNLHECKSSCFVSIKESSLHSFELTGIHFLGNCEGTPLIDIEGFNANEIVISNCVFDNIRSKVISGKRAKNLRVTSNRFEGCYKDVVFSDNMSLRTEITNNTFENCGRLLTQSFGITCSGEEFYIANNIFKDFEYSAIGVGVDQWDNKLGLCTGIIENNCLGYSDAYFLDYTSNTVMDAGAIYLWTQVDDIIIRYNYIHNYTGVKDYRGIFCDDGVSNFIIYGNVIVNTPSSYSVDSRLVEEYEAVKYVKNKNNIIIYNIVDNGIKLEGRDGINNCMAGGNVTLSQPNKKSDINLYSNVEKISDDIAVDWNGFSEKGIFVSPLAKKKIKRMPVYRKIKKYIH